MASKSSKSPHGISVALSADGQYVATVHGNLINITQTSDGQIVRSAPVHDQVKGRMRFLQWAKGASASASAPPSESASASVNSSSIDVITATYCHRLLCASASHISVLDVHDETWSAEIDAGGGDNNSNNNNFTHVDFTSNANEILAIAEFGVQLSVFSLDPTTPGEQHVIKSPKFANANTYALRPTTGHLALILKVDATDLLTVHELRSYEAIATAALPTVDAQGLKWSPNGMWLAVWDAASAGTKVVVFTADGQLFRTYTTADPDPDEAALDFGVRSVEWSPDSRFLAIGKHDGTVDLVNGQTFTLVHVLEDPMSVKPMGKDVYIEQPSGQIPGITEYALVPNESHIFPFTYNVASSSRAVATMSFNPSGSMLATVDAGLPHIVWMWDISGGSGSGSGSGNDSEETPRLGGALIQRASVRQLLWNPDLPELLMTTNDDEVVSVHQWICGHVPRIAVVNNIYDSNESSSSSSSNNKHSASWLPVGEESASSGLIWLGSSHSGSYTMGYVTGTGSSTAFNRIFCTEDPRGGPRSRPRLSTDDFPFT